MLFEKWRVRNEQLERENKVLRKQCLAWQRMYNKLLKERGECAINSKDGAIMPFVLEGEELKTALRELVHKFNGKPSTL